MRKVSGSVVFTAVFAALVTVGALILVAALRWHGASNLPPADPGSVSASGGTDCGGPCQVLASRNVNGRAVRLLADANGGNARFEAGSEEFEATVTALGARVDANSLSCVSASVPACLISATQNGGKIAQLLFERAGQWWAVERPYFSAAGVVVLNDLSGGVAPVVVIVDNSPAVARVYALDGSIAGCTRHYASVTGVRGWPDVRLVPADVQACSS